MLKLHCISFFFALFLKTVLLSANQNWDIFSCILLTVKLSTKEIQIKVRQRCNVGTKTSIVNNKSPQKSKSSYFRSYLFYMFSIRYSSTCKILLIHILKEYNIIKPIIFEVANVFHQSKLPQKFDNRGRSVLGGLRRNRK